VNDRIRMNSGAELSKYGYENRVVEWDDGDPHLLFTDLLKEYIKDTEYVLDIGCGNATKVQEISLSAACVIVLTSASGIENIPHRGNIQFVAADVDKLPFLDETIDLVYISSVIDLGDKKMLEEIIRVIHPDGAMVGLVAGESHCIETQEIFGRGRGWPPAKCVRFSIPERLRKVGMKLDYFAEYYGSGYSPSIAAHANLLASAQLIPDFDPVKDASLLREVERKLKTDRGIRDTEHLALFVARK